MITIFVRHEVENYPKWRAAYDEFDGTRTAMGVRAAAIYRSADDTNDVTVTHDFDSLDNAKAFASSQELRAAMQRAGVLGTPQVWFVSKA
ncbi:MAG: antibiotic biosynthesis monooxygenase [Alsobacter sp.]